MGYWKMETKIKTKYDILREKGLCYDCKMPLDREGVTCTKCNEKRNSEQRKYYQMYIEMGVCPKCHKNNIFPGERSCPECKAKIAEKMLKRRERNRTEYLEYQKTYSRKKREECVKEGKCTRCLSRKATPGYKTCLICRKNNTEYKRLTYVRKYEKGTCQFCGKPLEKNYKVCKEHYEKMLQMSKSEKAKAARKERNNDRLFLKKGVKK